MDTQTIDQEYAQLQTEFQDVVNTVQALAGKLQAADKAGDANAKEWLLDLKQIALDIKDEQIQANNLLQAIHQFVADAASQQASTPAPAAPQAAQQPQSMGLMGGMFGGGPFGGFLGGGFGRAMMAGAGIGLGEDVINSIFR